MSTNTSPDFAKLKDLLVRMRRFNTEREWAQFHNPKDLAISLTLEAGEVLEHFQWKSPDEMQKHLQENGQKVADELADVMYWVLLMSDYFKLDIVESLDRKMTENESKYPTDKAKGSHAKYTELQ
jgi:dCTP diphosphatase